MIILLGFAQRFQRLEEDGGRGNASEDEWVDGGKGATSDSECEADITFRPVYALWAERGLIPSRNMSTTQLRSAMTKRAALADRTGRGKRAQVDNDIEY